MKLSGRIATGIIKWMVDTACKIDDRELSKIPFKGPAIIIMNHTNFLEVPILYTHLLPRAIAGLAKEESWKIPVYGFLARQWGGVPIKRGSADMSAFRKIAEVMNQEKILVIAPEGTRNITGVLKKAYPGIITMAMQNNVPIIPVAHFGSEKFWKSFKKFRRTKFTFRVGRPFYINSDIGKVSGKIRQELLFSIMVQLAKILPEEYRGVYSDIESANEQYFTFLEEGNYSIDSPEPVWK